MNAFPTIRIALAAAALACLGWPAAGEAELPPGQRVDEKDACLQCHDLADAFTARVKHQPVVAGDCSACHNPHASRFDALLQERPGPLCAECHTEVREELARPVVHPPVAAGECAACHAPHGGAVAGLLDAPMGELCASCHPETATWSERRVQHPPFASGDCATCHEPHASQNAGLTIGSGAGVCTSCHAVDGAFRAAHEGYPVERASCATCHDPHASAQPGLFREALHEPFASGDCSTCHGSPSAADPFATVAPLGELCGQCHEEAVEGSRHAAFPHVPAGGGSCVACHNPHTGDGAGLLQHDEQTTCLACHDPGGAASGQKGHFATHAGLDCTTCHAPHGGERPLLFADDPVALCGSCHTHEHGVSHPMGEGSRDPRNGTPMDCRSCHGIHDSAYEFYLHRSSDRDLCLGCHKEIGGGQ